MVEIIITSSFLGKREIKNLGVILPSLAIRLDQATEARIAIKNSSYT